MSATPERFCVNCAYYELPAPDADPICTHSQKSPNYVSALYAAWLVTGHGARPSDHRHYRCSTERGEGGPTSCGPSGKFYVERKTP